MDDFFSTVSLFLIPAAGAAMLLGGLFLVLFLVFRHRTVFRPGDPVDPSAPVKRKGKGFLIAAIVLFALAFVLVLVYVIRLAVLFLRFGAEIFYAGLKSL